MKNSVQNFTSALGSVRLSLPLAVQLQNFSEFGNRTRLVQTPGQLISGERVSVPTYINEFWTAKQRQASSLHEVSYRACFKPQLPRFFIERLSQPGDVVYDPFMGRGTTPVEAALLGRVPWGNDINPLSLMFTQPRIHPPADILSPRHPARNLRPEEILIGGPNERHTTQPGGRLDLYDRAQPAPRLEMRRGAPSITRRRYPAGFRETC